MADESLGQLFVEFGAKTTELTEGVKTAIESVESGSAAMLKSVTSLGEVVTGIFAAIGAAAVYEFNEFEEASVKLANVLGGNTAAVNQISNAIRDMSTQIPFGAASMEKLAGQAAQLGIEKSGIVDFTKTVEEFSAVAGTSAEATADQFVKLANVTKMPHDEFENLASTVVALGDHMSTTQAKILDFSLQIAGTATQLRLTQPEILGMSAALSSLGVEGGMAMDHLMVQINKAANEGGPMLKQFAQTAGVSEKEFTAMFAQDATKAIQTFLDGLNKMNSTGRDVVGTLTNLGMGGQRMMEPLLKAAASGDIFAKGLSTANEAWIQNNALAQDAARHQETFSSQLTITLNLVKEILLKIGEQLTPTLLELNSMLQTVLKSSDDWGISMQKISTNVVPAIVTGVGLLGDAFNGWKMIIQGTELYFITMTTNMIDAIVKVIDTLKKLDGAILATLSPQASALAKVPTENLKAFSDALAKTGTDVQASFDKLVSEQPFSKKLLDDYEKFTVKVTEDNDTWIAGAWDGFDAGAVAAGEAIKKNVIDPLTLARNQAEALINGMQLPSGQVGGKSGKGGLSGFRAGIPGIPASLQDQGVNQGVQIDAEIKAAQDKLKTLKDIDAQELDLSKETKDKLIQLETQYGQKLQALQTAQTQLGIQQFGKMFDSFASIAESFGGKQSAAYMAMFAVSKAFAIADATVKIAQAIANASADPPLPFPANIANMASMAAATATIVSSIQAVTLNIQGKATGGSVMSGTPYIVGEAGPEMFIPSESGNIVPNNRLVTGSASSPKVVVNNYTDAKPEVQERQVGSEKILEVLIKKVNTDLRSQVLEGRGLLVKAMESTYNLNRGRHS